MAVDFCLSICESHDHLTSKYAHAQDICGQLTDRLCSVQDKVENSLLFDSYSGHHVHQTIHKMFSP